MCVKINGIKQQNYQNVSVFYQLPLFLIGMILFWCADLLPKPEFPESLYQRNKNHLFPTCCRAYKFNSA